MKKLVLLIVLVVLGAGCHLHHGVAGSGKRQKEKRGVGSFTSISTEGAFDVEVVCQKPQSLEIEGDDNVLPLVTTASAGLQKKNGGSRLGSPPISRACSA